MMNYSSSRNSYEILYSALNNNDVWADGLTVFYEIFKFLEQNVSERILPLEFHRTVSS
jgi:hypothetical protein